MSGSVPMLGDVVRLRGEVRERRIEPAVSLGRVAAGLLYGDDTGWQGSPEGFLERTYVTRAMRRVTLAAAARLSGRARLRLGDELVNAASVILLPSVLGGGKTHLMAFLLHVVHLAGRGRLDVLARHDPELASSLAEAGEGLAGARIAVIVGDQSRFAPTDSSPVEVDGVRVETIWDLMAAQLGASVEPLGWREAPSVDYIKDRVFASRPVLVVIDEIVSYLARIDEARRDQVVTFLRNLFQAANESPRAVVVLSLPAEASSAGDLGVVEHDALVLGRSAVQDIYNNARRVYPVIVQPLDMKTDIVMVLRKRLLENSVDELEDAGRRVAGLVRQGLEDSTMLQSVREVFGSEMRFLARTAEAYPFHPLFVEMLLDLGSVIRGFKRTRGLLEIVMDVLLDMEETGSMGRQYLVMPWNLRVEREDVRAKILADHPRLDYYNRVLLNDLQAINEVMSEDKVRREAALRIVRTVWLYSVGLGTLANIQSMIEKAPRVEALPAYIIEPGDASMGLTAGYIVTVAKDMAEIPKFDIVHYSGKLLYPLLPDINKIIMQRYENAEPKALTEELARYLPKIEERRGGFAQVTVILRKHSQMGEARSRIERVDGPVLTVYADIREELHAGEEDQLLPRNNTALVKAMPWESIESSPTAMGILESLMKRFPYIKKPRSMIELAQEIYKLYDAIENAINEIELTHDRDTAAIAVTKLKEAQSSLRRQAYASLALLFTRLKAGAGGKKEYSLDPQGSPSQSEDLATLAERAWATLLSRAITDLDWGMLVDVLSVLGKVGRREGLEGDDVILEPVSIADVWETLLRSRDERIPVHILDRQKFVKGLWNAYASNFEKLAFIDTGGRVYWIKPQQVSHEDMAGDTIDPGMLLDLDAGYKYSDHEIKRVIAPGGSLRGAIVHPVLIVDRLISSLLEEQNAPIKKGDVEVYRKYYLVDKATGAVEELDRFYTMNRNNDTILYRTLASSYIVYTERVVEKSYSSELIQPGVEEPLRYKTGETGVVKLQVRVSSEDYPYSIEVYALMRNTSTGDIIARDEKTVNKQGVREFSDNVDLELPVPSEPGEYLIEVYTRGKYPEDMYERKIATLKLVKEGYTCTTKTIPYQGLIQLQPGEKVLLTLKGVKIKARPGTMPQQLQANYNALLNLIKTLEPYKPVYNATFTASSGDFRIGFTLSNARAQELMKSVRTLTEVAMAANARIDDLDIEARLTGREGPISIETLAEQVKSLRLQGNAININLIIEECREV